MADLENNSSKAKKNAAHLNLHFRKRKNFFLVLCPKYCIGHNLFFLIFKIFIFYLAALGLSCSMWDTVSWPGIELRPPVSGAWRLSHCPTREILGHTYSKKLFIVYLKSKFKWAYCILSGNPTCRPVFSLILGLLKKVTPEFHVLFKKNFAAYVHISWKYIV